MPLLLAACALGLLVRGSQQVDLPTVEWIEEKVLSQRRSIVSGKVELDSEFSLRSGSRESPLRTKTTIWFEGQKIRGDRVRQNHEGSGGVSSSPYREISCFVGEKHIFWTDQSFPGGGAAVVRIFDRTRIKANSPMRVPDPRMVGLVPDASSELVKYHYEYILQRKDRHTPEVRKAVLRDVPCYEVSYRRLDDFIVQYWVAPQQDYGVIQMEEKRKDGTPITRLECELGLHEPSGLWFPRKAVFEAIPSTSNSTTYSEEVLLTVVALNEAINPEIFSLKGMDIPPGKHVSTDAREPPGGLVWNGIDVVPAQASPPVPKTTGGTTNQLWLFAASLVLAVAASLGLWKYLSAQRTRSHSSTVAK